MNLIFSSFKKDIRSISHTLAEGGDAAFHCKSILLRAIKEANAITLSCFLVRYAYHVYSVNSEYLGNMYSLPTVNMSIHGPTVYILRRDYLQ